MRIRPIESSDADRWLTLREQLWPDGDDHADEIDAFFRGQLSEPEAVLVCVSERELVVGIVELSRKEDLPGFSVQPPIGYIEGLIVDPVYRHLGIARTLLQASREWAKANNCRSFASDRADRVIIDTKFL